MTSPTESNIQIGCAGWSIRKEHVDLFDETGSHLVRYAGRFNCVEINTSFYKPHQAKTYGRWASSVPEHFMFAVKIPKEITHARKLIDVTESLERFLSEAKALGSKLGPLLVQLPPSFAFDNRVVSTFLDQLRQRFDGLVACEPRHVTWFTKDVAKILRKRRIALVAADPAVVAEAAEPNGWEGLCYFRLHGSPDVYYSSYTEEYLAKLATKLKVLSQRSPTWCIFDNTARGAATTNAIELLKALS